MEENKLITKQERPEIVVSPEKFPEIIGKQLSALDEIERTIKELNKKAEDAKKKAEALGSSNKGFKTKVKDFFTHGETKRQLSDTQCAQKDLAKVQELQNKVNENLLKHQTELAKCCNYLFCIGCYNIATIEAMIASLKKQLSGKSTNYRYLSDNVKEQFFNVIKRLKEQKDILRRQEQTEKRIEDQQGKFEQLRTRQQESERHFQSLHDNRQKTQKDIILRQEQTEKRIEDQQGKFERLRTRQQESESHFQSLLDDLKSSLLENSKLDKQQALRIEELFKLLKEKDSLDSKQSNQIDLLQKEVNNTNDVIDELSKQSKKRIFASFVISLISMIVSIVLLILHFTS